MKQNTLGIFKFDLIWRFWVGGFLLCAFGFGVVFRFGVFFLGFGFLGFFWVCSFFQESSFWQWYQFTSLGSMMLWTSSRGSSEVACVGRLATCPLNGFNNAPWLDSRQAYWSYAGSFALQFHRTPLHLQTKINIRKWSGIGKVKLSQGSLWLYTLVLKSTWIFFY